MGRISKCFERYMEQKLHRLKLHPSVTWKIKLLASEGGLYNGAWYCNIKKPAPTSTSATLPETLQVAPTRQPLSVPLRSGVHKPLIAKIERFVYRAWNQQTHAAVRLMRFEDSARLRLNVELTQGQGDRYGKAQSLGVGNNEGVNAQHAAVLVQQWSPAVARIDGGVGLNQAQVAQFPKP